MTNSYADNHDQNLTDGVKEIVDELQEDEEVPLNDPFAGNEGTGGTLNSQIPEEEQEDEMSRRGEREHHTAGRARISQEDVHSCGGGDREKGRG